jgi:hypothetical protein
VADGARDVDGAAAAGIAVEGDPAALRVFAQRSDGRTLDFGRTARGTNQWFVVPVRRDQYQRFRRSVLFDAPASHRLPFRQGLHGTEVALPRLNAIYGIAAAMQTAAAVPTTVQRRPECVIG